MSAYCGVCLSLGLSADNQNRLEEIAARYGRELVFVEMGDLKDRIGFQADTGGYDISIMSRLFMGEMLPDCVKRVLYLDCDTVVLASLKKLWQTDLKGRLFGAVMEPTIYPAVKASIGLGKEDPYFNSGVLLIDLPAGGPRGRKDSWWHFTAAWAGRPLPAIRIL